MPLPVECNGQEPEPFHREAALEDNGLQPKKRTPVGAMERDKWLRVAWRVTVAREFATERLVFVDEMGTNTSLHPLYAWSPKGERARCSVPRNRGPNTTLLLASMKAEGMGACLAVEGATTSIVFETYIEKVLLPSLQQIRASGGDGQPLGPQGRADQRAPRERGLRATLSASVLTGLQPYRRGLLEGQMPYS